MELKRILAKDARQANEKAIALYGQDVLVISSCQVRGQTELIVAVDMAPLGSEEAVHDASGTSHLPVVQLGAQEEKTSSKKSTTSTSGKEFKDNSLRFEDILSEELNQNANSKAEIVKNSNITPVKSLKKNKPGLQQVSAMDDVQAFEEKMLGHRGQKAQAALDNKTTQDEQEAALAKSTDKSERQMHIDAHELMRGQDIVELVRGELAQLRKEFRMTQQMNLWQMSTQIHPALVPLRQALQEAPIPAALKALLVDSIHQKETPESALQEIRSQVILGRVCQRPQLSSPPAGHPPASPANPSTRSEANPLSNMSGSARSEQKRWRPSLWPPTTCASPRPHSLSAQRLRSHPQSVSREQTDALK